MNPIDILIRSGFDPKGTDAAKKSFRDLGDSIKAGIGIDIGSRVNQVLQAIPQKLMESVQAGIAFNSMIEDTEMAFGVMLGSATAAEQRVRSLFDFAARTPFEFEEVAKASRILQSMTEGALASEKGLRLVGDAAAMAQRPFEHTAMWIGRLYAGLKTGTAVGEATRELIQMGVILGPTARELNRLAETGEGMADAFGHVERALARSTGAMEQMSKTLTGRTSTLKDNIRDLQGLATKDLTDAIKTQVGYLNTILESPVVQALVQVGAKLAYLKALGPLGTTLGPMLGLLNDPTNDQTKFPMGMTPSRGNFLKDLPAPLLTDAQIKTREELEKEKLEALRGGLEARQALEVEYAQRIQEIETQFANNAKARKEALAQVDLIFAEKRRALREIEFDEEMEDFEFGAAKRQARIQRELEQQDDVLRVQREGIALKRAELDADFKRPDFEKRGERVKLMRLEIELLNTLIEKLTQERDLENDRAAKAAISQRIQGLSSEKTALQGQFTGMVGGADPFSFDEQMTDKWARMMENMGTLAQQSANAFEASFMNAINSISDGITGLVMGTLEWGEALQQIGMNIMQTIINEIVRIGVQWFVTHVFMEGIASTFHAVMRALRWETAAEEIAAESSTLPVKATGAGLSAVSSFGVALAAVGVLAALIAGFAAGFKDGGFTGAGDPNEVAGVVHRGEYVFTAPQTAAIGRENLAAMARGGGWMNTGGLAAVFAGLPGQGAGGGESKIDASVNIAPVMHPDAIGQWAETTKGRKVIIDIVRGAALELGNQT